MGFQPDPPNLALYGESDEKFHIRGGNRLSGEIPISGAKNAALPCRLGDRRLARKLASKEKIRMSPQNSLSCLTAF